MVSKFTLFIISTSSIGGIVMLQSYLSCSYFDNDITSKFCENFKFQIFKLIPIVMGWIDKDYLMKTDSIEYVQDQGYKSKLIILLNILLLKFSTDSSFIFRLLIQIIVSLMIDIPSQRLETVIQSIIMIILAKSESQNHLNPLHGLLIGFMFVYNPALAYSWMLPVKFAFGYSYKSKYFKNMMIFYSCFLVGVVLFFMASKALTKSFSLYELFRVYFEVYSVYKIGIKSLNQELIIRGILVFMTLYIPYFTVCIYSMDFFKNPESKIEKYRYSASFMGSRILLGYLFYQNDQILINFIAFFTLAFERTWSTIFSLIVLGFFKFINPRFSSGTLSFLLIMLNTILIVGLEVFDVFIPERENANQQNSQIDRDNVDKENKCSLEETDIENQPSFFEISSDRIGHSFDHHNNYHPQHNLDLYPSINDYYQTGNRDPYSKGGTGNSGGFYSKGNVQQQQHQQQQQRGRRTLGEIRNHRNNSSKYGGQYNISGEKIYEAAYFGRGNEWIPIKRRFTS